MRTIVLDIHLYYKCTIFKNSVYFRIFIFVSNFQCIILPLNIEDFARDQYIKHSLDTIIVLSEIWEKGPKLAGVSGFYNILKPT
jgi:hypothetical protein